MKHSLAKRASSGAAELQHSGDPEAGADDRGVQPEAEADGRRQRSPGGRGELHLLRSWQPLAHCFTLTKVGLSRLERSVTAAVWTSLTFAKEP